MPKLANNQSWRCVQRIAKAWFLLCRCLCYDLFWAGINIHPMCSNVTTALRYFCTVAIVKRLEEFCFHSYLVIVVWCFFFVFLYIWWLYTKMNSQDFGSCSLEINEYVSWVMCGAVAVPEKLLSRVWGIKVFASFLPFNHIWLDIICIPLLFFSIWESV